ncbi:D-2-hydroxyacid dehydrogenase [Aestuariibacter sp. A3R04]|uniref:D-2-hydroxyacid dehydrogenase n=1 Tax=Aestuariibacter sp. A3R04 TaxID=2841571 RepID=UPI001C0886E8|nr:D-2-hydroxyacid dehydrogenase [Aestuariibacter sp. A3R04]MBU3020284.1 D-2-hydroxyacid dehydrogenase [Aestuariibacter sp. A3R04]
MKAVLLDADTLHPTTLDLRRLTDLPITLTQYAQTSMAECAERIADADIILTNKVILNEKLLSHAHKCQYIGVMATGTNNIDKAYCQSHGITVANVEGYGTDAVAQHALMLLLNLTTSFNAYQRDVNQGVWSDGPHFCLLNHPVYELAGKHLVIVGYGELGRRFAELARALGMRVSVAARPGKADDCRPTLDKLLPEADVVSLHCLLSDDTYHLIDKTRLSLMKPTALLINTARGALIDEHALLVALKSGTIGGAGLDGLSAEPPPRDHPLLNTGLSNLLITPHSAWVAAEARQRLVNIAAKQLADFLAQIGAL